MYDELLETALAAAQAGAEVIKRWFRDADLEVRRKGQNDFVTRADQESEAAVLAEIRRRYPDHGILAEEGTGNEAVRGSDYQWLVDPLDGTTNFLQGLPVYCVSVACRRGDELAAAAIVDPEGGNMFTATRGGGAFWNGRRMEVSRQEGLDGSFLATGYPFRALPTLDVYLAIFRDVFLHSKAIRRCGSAALDLAYTAAGVYDGFFEFRLSPWDIGAGILLIREAGGMVTDLDGGHAYFRSGNILAGGPAVHEGLLAVAARHASEAEIDLLNPIANPVAPAASVGAP